VIISFVLCKAKLSIQLPAVVAGSRRSQIYFSNGKIACACAGGIFCFTRFSGSSSPASFDIAGVLLVFSYLIVPAVCGINLAWSLANRLLIGWAIALLGGVAGGRVVSLFPMGPALGRGHRLHIWCAAYRDRICGLVSDEERRVDQACAHFRSAHRYCSRHF
jgi:hypothetical protein